MNKDKIDSIGSFLKSNKKDFIEVWWKKVNQILTSDNRSEKAKLHNNEFEQLFDVYIDDMMKSQFLSSKQFLIELIQRKLSDGFLLSTLELINASFMDTARSFFRSVFPDAFDKRMEYLQRLSQMILNNEVMIAKHYENYLNDLNGQLLENTETLKRHNSALIEFIDLATHQLQTPLWSILGFVSKLQRKYYKMLDEHGRHCLNRITANVSDMHQLIEDVTTMLMIDQGDMIQKELYLYDLLKQAIKRVNDEIDKTFECTFSKECNKIIIKGDPHHIKQLFYQIIKNAAQYSINEKHGQAKVTCKMSENFHIYIEDNGIGIEKRYRNLVFKPMERLKEKEIPGSGMGLAFAIRIIIGHGGKIDIENPKEYKGICVHIEIPKDIIISTDEGLKE